MAGDRGMAGLRRQLKLLRRAPAELRILYILNFLNSYKYFSMALVLPIIATSEYGFSDVSAGALYGAWGILITLWGFIASFMVDMLGVRFTAIFSTLSSILARAVFVFCRSQTSLLVVVLLLSPMGDGTFDPCFNVGVKKCTTDTTRPFAYALAYTVMNLGGAFTDNLTEAIRRLEFFVGGVWFSGLRCVLFSSLVLMVIALVFAVFGLRELSAQEAEAAARSVVLTPPTRTTPELRRLAAARGAASPGTASAIAARGLGRRPGDGSAGGKAAAVLSAGRRFESPRWVASALSPFGAPHQERRLRDERVARRQERGDSRIIGENRTVGGAGENRTFAADLELQPLNGNKAPAARKADESTDRKNEAMTTMELLRLGNFWRVVAFMTFVLFVSQQWRFMDLLMPKYTTRCFGENAPFAALASINFWGCVFFPPLISSMTSGRDDIEVMLPGIWIMALAPIPMLMFESLSSVAAWVALITLGEVIWSPRSSSYAASMAPTGREGLFLMLSSWPTYLTKYPAGLFSGWLLDTYFPDCPSCRDGFGHFCSVDPERTTAGDMPTTATDEQSDSGVTCVSSVFGAEGSAAVCPDSIFFSRGGDSGTSSAQCAQTCVECPAWAGNGRAMFTWVFGIAIVSPILVSLFFQLLRRPPGPNSPPYVPLPEMRVEFCATNIQQGPHDSAKDSGIYGYGTYDREQSSTLPKKAKSITIIT